MKFWQDGEWRASPSNDGKPWSPEDFADWYSCPGAYIPAGKTCTDPQNWNSNDTGEATRGLWYFSGVDDKGNAVQAEAEIECLAVGNK